MHIPSSRPGRRPLLETIAALLDSAPEPLRVIEIRGAVESVLGYDVPISSIKNCLAKDAKRTNPTVRRVGHGRYGIRRLADLTSGKERLS